MTAWKWCSADPCGQCYRLVGPQGGITLVYVRRLSASRARVTGKVWRVES